MKHYASLRVRVVKDVITRIHRSLKGKGQIRVSVGREVTPDEIIGEASVSSGFRTLNLATLLSVPPSQVEKYLAKNLGQRIYKDELLAFKRGALFWGKKVVVAPTDGILDFLNPKTGEVRMTFLPKKQQLPSGVYGVVEVVDKIRGQVIIRTQVSKIYGMFGSGKLRDGTLQFLGKREDLIGQNLMSARLSDNILVGGSLIFKDAISAAISASINGIITGGINAKDFRGMAGGRLNFPRKIENDIGVSIIVCEGFGSIPISGDIYQILSEYEGKFVSLDGNKAIINLPSFESSSIIRVKNTKLPPLRTGALDDNILESGVCELTLGMKVRTLGNAYAGNIGKVVGLDQSETLLPSGIKTFLATIETKRRKIKLPVANIEVISGA